MFSLFVAVTALCVAAGAWWNWPFEIEVHHDPIGGTEGISFGCEQVTEGGCSYPKTLRVAREMRTVCGWGIGDVVQHGLTRYFDKDDRLLGEDTFFRGLRHGASRRYFLNGSLRTEGTYCDGRKEGRWTERGWFQPSAGRRVTHEHSWRHDRAHGTWRWFNSDGTVEKAIAFQEGELIQVDGKPALDALFLQLRDDRVKDPDVAKLLLQSRQLDFQNRTERPEPSSFGLYIGRQPGLVKWDPEHFQKELPLGGLPVRNRYHEDLPLHAAFAVVLSPHGLACLHEDNHLRIVPIQQAARKLGIAFPPASMHE
ncbi:MAG TPA: hypothetical protein VMP01_29400 [Pirellulaceae bacterium]|nr:hypothetical protein [Pirellulaceae bacterium]